MSPHWRQFNGPAVWPKKIVKRLQKLPKNDFTRKIKEFDTFTKIAKNVWDLGKLIVAKGFKKLPKVHKIAQSGHTAGQGKKLQKSVILIFLDKKCAIWKHLAKNWMTPYIKRFMPLGHLKTNVPNIGTNYS